MQAAGLHDTHYLKRNFDDKAKSSSFFLIKDRSSCLWLPLFPTEQTRIIRLLVRRVTVTTSGLEVDIRRDGVAVVTLACRHRVVRFDC